MNDRQRLNPDAAINVQAEISLYPLGVDELGQTIDSFVEGCRSQGLTISVGAMSSLVSGNAAHVFAGLARGFESVATDHQVVLIIKLSNACPVRHPTQAQPPAKE